MPVGAARWVALPVGRPSQLIIFIAIFIRILCGPPLVYCVRPFLGDPPGRPYRGIIQKHRKVHGFLIYGEMFIICHGRNSKNQRIE